VPNLVYSTASADPNIDGWNFIGNPLTCALDFGVLTKSNIAAGFSIWDPVSESYLDQSQLSGGAVVAPMQGFWVKATAANPLITGMDITGNAAVVSANPAFYKTSVADRFYIQVSAQNNPNSKDEILVGMVTGTTDGLDAAWDAAARLNPSSVPTLMMKYQNEQIAHNAIDYGPQYTTTKQLPLHFSVDGQGDAYSFDLYDSLLTNSYTIFLEDQKTGTFHDLSTGSYTFLNDIALPTRFVLHLSANAIGVDDLQSAKQLHYRISGNELIIFGTTEQQQSCALIGMNGQCVRMLTFTDNEQEQRFSLEGLSSGIYILQLGNVYHKVILP
jgi:hypothetical protein